MRTTTHKLAAILLIAAIAITGCKKDAAEEDTDIDAIDATGTMATVPVTSDTIAGEPADTTMQSGPVRNESNSTGRSDKSGAGSARGGSAKSQAKDNSEGYSAPDGTDAENHDNDQYTKNNQKPMPSGGTSIK